ncbi:VPLPA-CTERM sorting domain-containing protein [Pseudoduganella eburnea]|uniref:VPLPA-CTERM sorting domain-containing protein n=1 Tax=Massilia eburnea TaxID=1776165 RepID=A0A6L6QGE5_9BURK|nr:VPLPA-CTERM sorting domain-containing protein [Massilia eburnea]
MTKLTTLFCAAALAFSASAHAGVAPILSGFSQTTVAAEDDGSTLVNLANGLKLGLNGATYSSLYVNTNGNVSFGQGLSTYAPGAFNGDSFGHDFLAPFFGDVDIRDNHGSIGYGNTMFEGHNAMAVTWSNVGYYNKKNDLQNTFQLVLVDRSDTGANNFDFYYNYGSIQWDSTSNSDKAHAGFHLQGTAADFEFDGSGNPGKVIDSGKQSLVKGSNVGLSGRYAFNVRGGVAAYGLEQLTPAQSVPLPGSLPLVGIGAIALAYGRRRKA